MHANNQACLDQRYSNVPPEGACPRNLWEMQTIQFYYRLKTSETLGVGPSSLRFNKISQRLSWLLTFEKLCSMSREVILSVGCI